MKYLLSLVFVLSFAFSSLSQDVEYENYFFYAKLDTVRKHCTIVFYLRGKHYCSIKNGAYVITKSPLKFNKPYGFYYTSTQTEIVIEKLKVIKGRQVFTVVARYTLFKAK